MATVVTRAIMASKAARRVVRAPAARRALAAPAITDNVSFDNVAREWRCKWSPDNDKASLTAVQAVLADMLPTVKAVDGVASVQRVVCGGCLDFKVITSMPADKFGEWESAGFAPEADFLAKIKAIDGVSLVETQTFTLEQM